MNSEYDQLPNDLRIAQLVNTEPVIAEVIGSNLSTLSTSNVSDEWKSWRRLRDHGGLSSSRGP